MSEFLWDFNTYQKTQWCCHCIYKFFFFNLACSTTVFLRIQSATKNFKICTKTHRHTCKHLQIHKSLLPPVFVKPGYNTVLCFTTFWNVQVHSHVIILQDILGRGWCHNGCTFFNAKSQSSTSSTVCDHIKNVSFQQLLKIKKVQIFALSRKV